MKIELLEPKHRCKKCGTPLIFQHNYILNDEELEEKIILLKKNWNWFKKIVCDNTFLRINNLVDQNRQHWKCPKCHEDYLVTLKENKK